MDQSTSPRANAEPVYINPRETPLMVSASSIFLVEYLEGMLLENLSTTRVQPRQVAGLTKDDILSGFIIRHNLASPWLDFYFIVSIMFFLSSRMWII